MDRIPTRETEKIKLLVHLDKKEHKLLKELRAICDKKRKNLEPTKSALYFISCKSLSERRP